MSGDSGNWTRDVIDGTEKVSKSEKVFSENLEFERLIKKIGFYQR